MTSGRPLALGVGQVGGGEEAAEVGVALAGLGEQHQVVRVVGWRGGAARPAAPAAARRGASPAPPAQQRLHPYLGSEDGLDAVLGAGLGEAHRAVETVVVGEGQGRLPQLGRPRDQLLDPAAAVQEGEVGVHVQVDERNGVRRRRWSGAARLLFVVLERPRIAELVDGADWRRPAAVLPDVVVAGRDPLGR